MGAGASVRRSAASMSVEIERLRERELNFMEETEKQASVKETKTGVYIKQLVNENHELREQLRDVSKAMHVQSEGWKKEKNKTLELMFSELPLPMLSTVPSDLSGGRASLTKNFPMVTIAQCDVAGFSSLSSVLTPKELITVIDHLQALIDEAFSNKDVFIMERTSDGCIAVSGLDEDVTVENPTRALSPLSMTDSSYGSDIDISFSETQNYFAPTKIGNSFRKESLDTRKNSEQKSASFYADIMATCALKLLADSSKITVPLPDKKQLQLRIALHSAPCSGGVVGLQTSVITSHIPRYRLFGPPMRYTSNLCLTGLALQIRVSKPCRDLLENFRFERCPDYMTWETKKSIESYWLVGKDDMVIKLPSLDQAISLSEYEDVEV